MRKFLAFPEFLKKFDNYLLQHHPVLWASRLHFWGYVVITSMLFATFVSVFTPLLNKDNGFKSFILLLLPLYFIFAIMEPWQSGVNLDILSRFSIKKIGKLWAIFLVTSGICSVLIILPSFIDNLKIRYFFDKKEINAFERLVSLERFISTYIDFAKTEELDVVLDDSSSGNYFNNQVFKDQLIHFVKGRRGGIDNMKLDSITYQEYFQATDSLYRVYWPETMKHLSRASKSDTIQKFKRHRILDFQLIWILNDNKVNNFILESSNRAKAYELLSDVRSAINTPKNNFKKVIECTPFSEIRTGSLPNLISGYNAPFPTLAFMSIWLGILLMPFVYMTRIGWSNQTNWRYKHIVLYSFIYVGLGVFIFLFLFIESRSLKTDINWGKEETWIALWSIYIFMLLYNFKLLNSFKARILHRNNYYPPLLLLWLHLFMSSYIIIDAYDNNDWQKILWFVPLNSIVYLLITAHIKRLDALPRQS